MCVAAVSARLTALDAVAENMGVSSQDIADKSKEKKLFRLTVQNYSHKFK